MNESTLGAAYVQGLRKTKQLVKSMFLDVYPKVIINPKLTIAIIDNINTIDKKNSGYWLFKWDQDISKCLIFKMYDSQQNVENFTFSPNGEWLVFKDYNQYYTMKVDPELPHFLSEPIILKMSDLPSGDNTTLDKAVWTRNPLSLVTEADNGKKIYRWEFDKIDYKLGVWKKLQEKKDEEGNE